MENNNKLIAEFMGINHLDDDKYINNLKEMKAEGLYFEQGYMTSELKFDTDWNWLMPVVERIELDMGFDVYIHYNNCTITDGENAFENEAEPNQKIYATYQSVVEFIKWYNENK
jgi:hypothetical protein